MPHLDKLVSPPIALLLMARNLYLPSLVSSALTVLCIVLIRRVENPAEALETTSNETYQPSEPLLRENAQLQITRGRDRAPSVDDIVDTRGDEPADPVDSTSRPDILVTETLLSRSLRRLRNIVGTLHSEPIVGFCYVAFYLKSVAMASETFVFQYLSEKFGWPLKETTILRFALSIGAILATLVIGPLVSSRLSRRGVPIPMIDMGIIYVSLFTLTVCFVVAWRAESSIIFILCMRIPLYLKLLRSLIRFSNARCWFLRGS